MVDSCHVWYILWPYLHSLCIAGQQWHLVQWRGFSWSYSSGCNLYGCPVSAVWHMPDKAFLSDVQVRPGDTRRSALDSYSPPLPHTAANSGDTVWNLQHKGYTAIKIYRPWDEPKHQYEGMNGMWMVCCVVSIYSICFLKVGIYYTTFKIWTD